MIDLDKIKPGMSRGDVVAIFGEPDDTGGTSRKYNTPRTYVYGDFEVNFEPWKAGKVTNVWNRKEHRDIKSFTTPCPKCSNGFIEKQQIPHYHTKTSGKDIVVPLANVGVCSFCGNKVVSLHELRRWKRIANGELNVE